MSVPVRVHSPVSIPVGAIDSVAATAAATMLKAVAHPLRLRIVDLLAAAPLHVGALAEQLDASQPVVSQQLRILRMHGLVRFRTEGGLSIYELTQPALLRLLDCVKHCLTDAGPRTEDR